MFQLPKLIWAMQIEVRLEYFAAYLHPESSELLMNEMGFTEPIINLEHMDRSHKKVQSALEIEKLSPDACAADTLDKRTLDFVWL